MRSVGQKFMRSKLDLWRLPASPHSTSALSAYFSSYTVYGPVCNIDKGVGSKDCKLMLPCGPRRRGEIALLGWRSNKLNFVYTAPSALHKHCTRLSDAGSGPNFLPHWVPWRESSVDRLARRLKAFWTASKSKSISVDMLRNIYFCPYCNDREWTGYWWTFIVINHH